MTEKVRYEERIFEHYLPKRYFKRCTSDQLYKLSEPLEEICNAYGGIILGECTDVDYFDRLL